MAVDMGNRATDSKAMVNKVMVNKVMVNRATDSRAMVHKVMANKAMASKATVVVTAEDTSNNNTESLRRAAEEVWVWLVVLLLVSVLDWSVVCSLKMPSTIMISKSMTKATMTAKMVVIMEEAMTVVETSKVPVEKMMG